MTCCLLVRLLPSPPSKLGEEALPRYWLPSLHRSFVNPVNHFVNTLTNIWVLVIFSPGKYALFVKVHMRADNVTAGLNSVTQ